MRPSPEVLAITPAQGSPDPALISAWTQSGLLELNFALLLRSPGEGPTQILHPEHRLSALRRAASEAGIPVWLAVDPDQLAAGLRLLTDHPLEGIYLRGAPAISTLERASSQARVGASTHLATLDAALKIPLSFRTFAPVFPPDTPTSGHTKHAVGLEALRAVCDRSAAAVLALGGVRPGRVRACRQAGAHGIAGISGFFGAPEEVVQHGRAYQCAWAAADVLPPKRPG